MRVTVRIPTVLRADCGGAASLDLTLKPEANLGDLFDAVADSHPRLERRVRDEQGRIRRYVNVYVDGEESRHVGGGAARLADGSEIQILPSVAGG